DAHGEMLADSGVFATVPRYRRRIMLLGMTNAIEHFTARLSFETDVSDVAADLAAGTPGFVLVDSRGPQAWAQGRIPGAVHLPTADIAVRAAELIPAGASVVT